MSRSVGPPQPFVAAVGFALVQPIFAARRPVLGSLTGPFGDAIEIQVVIPVHPVLIEHPTRAGDRFFRGAVPVPPPRRPSAAHVDSFVLEEEDVVVDQGQVETSQANTQ
jgi:hypothetical protein